VVRCHRGRVPAHVPGSYLNVMGLDWFARAPLMIAEVRERFQIPPQSVAVGQAGSSVGGIRVGPAPFSSLRDGRWPRCRGCPTTRSAPRPEPCSRGDAELPPGAPASGDGTT